MSLKFECYGLEWFVIADDASRTLLEKASERTHNSQCRQHRAQQAKVLHIWLGFCVCRPIHRTDGWLEVNYELRALRVLWACAITCGSPELAAYRFICFSVCKVLSQGCIV